MRVARIALVNVCHDELIGTRSRWQGRSEIQQHRLPEHHRALEQLLRGTELDADHR